MCKSDSLSQKSGDAVSDEEFYTNNVEVEQERSRWMPYPGGFFPGDSVKVIDGTFIGSTGKVVSPEEAEKGRWRSVNT